MIFDAFMWIVSWIAWCIPGTPHKWGKYLLTQQRLAREGTKRAKRKSAGSW